MRTTHTLHFDILARDLATRVGATVRRWWREPKHVQRFHVEAVRTFVGAKPVVIEFTATLDTARPPQLQGQLQMRVVMEAPPFASAVPATNGTSPDLPRRPRTVRRSRTAQPRVRTDARSAAKAHLYTARARTPRKARSPRRSRARR
jgi:hypothetical protein